MKHTWILTKMRMRLATRNRAFFFFGLVMPLLTLTGAVLFFGSGKSEWRGYILGVILTVTVMGSFGGLSVQLVTFREKGILRQFHLALLGAGSMLASSILSNYFMALPVVIFEILVCHLALQMQSWGNLWAIFILVTIGSATFSALGLIIASVTNSMQETQIINNLIFMVLFFLSGATIPLAWFPDWLQREALFIPAQYLATGLESAGANMATGYEVLEDSGPHPGIARCLRSLAPAFPLGARSEDPTPRQSMGAGCAGTVSAFRRLGKHFEQTIALH